MNQIRHPAFFLRVAVPSPLRKLFDYLPLPDAPLPLAGSRVRVPFGRQQITGMVVSVESDTEVEPEKLKQISTVIDDSPLLDRDLLALYRWASDYYLFPIGMALQTSLPPAIRAGKPLHTSVRMAWRPSAEGESLDLATLARARLQQRVLEMLRSYRSMTTAEINAVLGKTARPVLEALATRKLIEAHAQDTPGKPEILLKEAALALNPGQQRVLKELASGLQEFHCHLLEGITGSGKTEIYLQLIAQVLAGGGQVLVLVPEISLTPQTLQRFSSRFHGTIVSFHSGLRDTQRHQGWAQAQSGMADIVIGTRSAVFTPLPRLSLIIVDEEHDDSYKQQDGFRYSARDVAVKRASQLDIPVVLGTATPSLESLNNALSGRYRHVTLDERAGGAVAPGLQLIDMRLQESHEGFSVGLQQHIRAQLEARQQVLVFLNRRGFAPLLQCQDCGWIAECPRCERSYTVHQQPVALRCHHCEASKPLPFVCPNCKGTHLGGIGQGTERSEAWLQQAFPDFPVIRIDRDTTRAAGSLQQKMDTIRSGLPCILLGTQMLAKGHHFPNVTLAAILDADSGLFSADFRGQENLGQLLTQVAGRAGRGERKGLVLIQSYHVQHPLLQQLTTHGYGSFARLLLAERKLGGLPPFAHLVLFRAESVKRQLPLDFLQHCKSLVGELMKRNKVEIHGPMPSPLGKKAGLFRAQLLLLSPKRKPLQDLVHQVVPLLEVEKTARQVRWLIDVDPIDFS